MTVSTDCSFFFHILHLSISAGDLLVACSKRGQLTWILPESGGCPVHTRCTQSQFLGGGCAGGHQVAVASKVQIAATGGT